MSGSHSLSTLSGVIGSAVTTGPPTPQRGWPQRTARRPRRSCLALDEDDVRAAVPVGLRGAIGVRETTERDAAAGNGALGTGVDHRAPQLGSSSMCSAWGIVHQSGQTTLGVIPGGRAMTVIAGYLSIERIRRRSIRHVSDTRPMQNNL